MVILSAFFVVTQLVTETSRLPTFLRTVKLPFGHPIAIAVCVWVGIDLVRRLRRGTPLDAETDDPALGDAFEAGTEPDARTVTVIPDEPHDLALLAVTTRDVERAPPESPEPVALSS
jgi:hypothetical protein